ncbi:GGDEF domain-containing protein [Marinimicrobium sp. C2-29]|uniref:GGDEF domain-containing protein n=1 Tax=Marinimicrobium sp. C2-29 TaxID=3139825 RepID=UPI0031391D25
MTNRLPEDSDTWREKYLNALDVQEALERSSEEQYQRLRRAIVQLSIVADGQDAQLDEVLDELRRALRSDAGMERLTELTDQLNERVHESEQHREQANAEIVEAITTLVNQLQSLGPPRETKKELSHYLNRLPMRSQKFSLFPALLHQLAQLQHQVIEQTREKRPGLLGRWRGESQESGAGAALQSDVNQSLESLLGAINTEYLETSSLAGLQERLHRGLKQDELPAFLEEVRDLIMHAWLAANRVFASYLNSVNNELADISRIVTGAVNTEADRTRASRTLHDDLTERCQSLAGSVDEAGDLQELKSRVSSQLGQIRNTLTQYQQSEAQSTPLTEQLEQLVNRVQTMEKEAEENRASLSQHRHKALHDPLTQLPNREAYEERLALEVARWQRYGHPLTLAVCDVDNFKRINDRFGHLAGDRVLKVITRAIGRRLREVDFFGRYGGEEFVLLMPDTSAASALGVLDDVRTALADTAFHYRKEPLTITVSIGISEFREGDSADQVFGRADQALYSAKAAGRNQCQIG